MSCGFDCHPVGRPFKPTGQTGQLDRRTDGQVKQEVKKREREIEIEMVT